MPGRAGPSPGRACERWWPGGPRAGVRVGPGTLRGAAEYEAYGISVEKEQISRLRGCSSWGFFFPQKANKSFFYSLVLASQSGYR